MKTKTVITTNISDLVIGVWDENTDEFTPIEDLAEEFKAKALHNAILMFQDLLQQDLTDIWRRIDNMERKEAGE